MYLFKIELINFIDSVAERSVAHTYKKTIVITVTHQAGKF